MSADPFLAQLAELCRQHPTRAKWVFVPTHAVGLTIGDRLARNGTNWVNLRFVTPLDVAIPMAAPFLLERGIDPSEDPLGPPLIMRLLLDLPEEGGYFRPMAEQASMADALWATIRELRFAGIDAGSLAAAAFRHEAKFHELVTLIRAYEQHLEHTGTADMAVVFSEALDHHESCPIRAEDVWVELPDVVWAPIVRRFLDALPGTRESPRTSAIDFPVPRRVLALGSPRIPAPDEPAAPRATVRIFRAGGHEAEVDEVIRRVLASGRYLDEVEVVCGSEALALLAWEKAKRLDWPVTSSAGLAAVMTRPGRALYAWCGWIEGGFAAAHLRRMLASGDVTLGPQDNRARSACHAVARQGEGGPSTPTQDECVGRGSTDDVSCSTQQAARILRRAGATWGRVTYRTSLASYADRQERQAREQARADEFWRLLRSAQARWLIRTIETLLEPIPDPDADGLVTVADLLDAAEAFVGGYARRAGDLDAAGHLAVIDVIQSLRPLGLVRGPLPWALRFLTDGIQSARVARSRSKPGHLHISAFIDPGYDGRPLTFVCGLEEARVFPASVEDPVLLDGERQAIEQARPSGGQTWLRTSGDHVDEAVYAGLTRLARLGTCSDEVVLSYSSVDTREFRETFPSWLVLRAYRAACGNERAGYQELRQAAGDPVSVVPASPGTAPTTGAWWLNAARIGEPAIAEVVSAYPAIGGGLRALAARASDGFTEFDGFAPEAGCLLDPSRHDIVVSATTLESAAHCPFRYFLEAGLGIESLDEEDADADVWLDPLRRGSELHALYAALLRRARAANRRVSARRDLDWFVALGTARLDELRQEIPPPSEEVAAREAAELLEDLRLFVTAEEEARGIEPVAFEVSFGRPGDDEGEALAAPDPVVIDLGVGRRVIVTGRIDRIDRLRETKYRIVDYKTGRFYSRNYTGTFRRGTLLQHALYGVAAARLLMPIDMGAMIAEGVYWHPTSRGWGRMARLPAPSRAALENVLAILCDVLGHGVFLQAPERQEKGQRYTRDACRFCDFKPACGAAPAPIAARKVDANTDDRLAPWLALQEVE